MFMEFNHKNIIFILIITLLQLSSILSEEEKCYSIKNCLKCPELDFCQLCKDGYKLNKPKTKCKGEGDDLDEEGPVKSSKSSPSPSRAAASSPVPNPSPSKKDDNNELLNRPGASVNKAPNNPFQNVPISSIQKFKEKDTYNEIINKILIVILIILIISIIASVIYNFVKKRMGGYTSEDYGQDESAKVVYIR